MKKFGIDLSSWQKGYPYARATREGVEFAILRAGFSQTKDNEFETHYKNAKAQGWGIGAYWYTYAETITEARKEAKAFLKAIKRKKFDYPIYLDIEDSTLRKLGKTTLNNIVKEFGAIIQEGGYYFGVYTNADWYRNILSGSTLNKKYDWWIASWTKTKPTGIDAGLWQFGGSSNAIRSPRIAGIVTDQDYAYKDYPTIIKEAGLNGYNKPDKEPTTGNYEALKDVILRAGPKSTYRAIKVKEMTPEGKKCATSTRPLADAEYKKGTVFTAKAIYKNNLGSYWGKTPSGWVCIKSKLKTYCKKI